MSLNGMSGTYYDYKSEFIFNYLGAGNKIVHDGVYVGAAQSLSGGSADFSAAASALAKSKAAAGFELVLYTKQGWVTVNRLITLVARVS
jgi:molybdopterin-containing oxidoreductase family iron-sulfur binding subunit